MLLAYTHYKQADKVILILCGCYFDVIFFNATVKKDYWAVRSGIHSSQEAKALYPLLLCILYNSLNM